MEWRTSIRESLQIGWFLAWRHLVFPGTIGGTVGLYAGLLAEADSPLARLSWFWFLLGLAILGGLPTVFTPWVFRRLLHKRFHGFRVTVAGGTDVEGLVSDPLPYRDLVRLSAWWLGLNLVGFQLLAASAGSIALQGGSPTALWLASLGSLVTWALVIAPATTTYAIRMCGDLGIYVERDNRPTKPPTAGVPDR